MRVHCEAKGGEGGGRGIYGGFYITVVYTLRCATCRILRARLSRGISLSRGRHVRKVETSRVHGTGRRDKLARRHGSPYFHACLDSMETVRGIFGVHDLWIIDWWVGSFQRGYVFISFYYSNGILLK